MNFQDEQAMLRMIMEESRLEICSADGSGLLCNNYGEYFLNCGHHVCVVHKEFNEETAICYACEAVRDRAARRIQRWWHHCLLKIRLKRICYSRENSANKIKSFLKMVVAKRKVRDLRRKRARERFLDRFDNKIPRI